MKYGDSDKNTSTLRWCARILGTGVFLFFVSLIVLGKISPIWNQPLTVQIQFAGVFIFLLGCLEGWRREGLAAFLILVGYAMFLIIDGKLPWPPTLFELVLLTGVLYLVSWWKSAVKVSKA